MNAVEGQLNRSAGGIPRIAADPGVRQIRSAVAHLSLVEP